MKIVSLNLAAGRSTCRPNLSLVELKNQQIDIIPPASGGVWKQKFIFQIPVSNTSPNLASTVIHTGEPCFSCSHWGDANRFRHLERIQIEATSGRQVDLMG